MICIFSFIEDRITNCVSIFYEVNLFFFHLCYIVTSLHATNLTSCSCTAIKIQFLFFIQQIQADIHHFSSTNVPNHLYWSPPTISSISKRNTKCTQVTPLHIQIEIDWKKEDESLLDEVRASLIHATSNIISFLQWTNIRHHQI